MNATEAAMAGATGRSVPNRLAWRRPLMHLAIVVTFVLVTLASAPVSKNAMGTRSRQVNPEVAAAHMASVRADASSADASVAQPHARASTHDLALATRAIDAAQPHPTTRVTVHSLPTLRAGRKR